IDAIVLKEQPLTPQASRYRAIRYQGVRSGEITQFTDVLIRLPQVRHGQKDRKDQGQGSAKRGGAARLFAFLSGALCIIQRLVEKASVQERTCHADEQEARIMKKILL